MVNYLEIIDWEKLGASKLPEKLVQLITESNEGKRNEAWHMVDNMLNAYQSFEDLDRGYGSYGILKQDIHFYTIPYFLDVLSQNQDDITLSGCLFYLWNMAKYIRFNDLAPEHVEKARQIHMMVWSGTAIYLRLLNNDKLRSSVLWILAEYPEFEVQLTSVFQDTILQAQDMRKKANLVVIMQHMYLLLDEVPDYYVAFLNKLVESDKESLFAKTVGLCLAEIQKQSAPQWAIETYYLVHDNMLNSLGYPLPVGYEKVHNLKKIFVG